MGGFVSKEDEHTTSIKEDIQTHASKDIQQIESWKCKDLTKLAKDLSLNGKPLPAPRMHPVDWKEGQVFTEKEDPDRMSCPWNVPKFINENDPILQREKLSVDEIDLESIGVNPNPNERWPYASFAKVISNVLAPKECEELLCCVNEKGNLWFLGYFWPISRSIKQCYLTSIQL